MFERALICLDSPITVFLNILIGKRHLNNIITMAELITPFDLHFKEILDTASPLFAWEVMQLQIELQQQQKPSMQQVMKLIQLYMIGVEVLQNEDDPRYNYFNNKIHSLMMRKTVVEQLHRATTGRSPDIDTLQMIQKRELESRKSDHELQVFLQKDQYNLGTIKEIIKKEETHNNRKEEKIKNHIIGQHQALEERIRTRRMRSISGSKGKNLESLKEPPLSPRVSSRVFYTMTPQIQKKEENVVTPIKPHPPRPRLERRQDKT